MNGSRSQRKRWRKLNLIHSKHRFIVVSRVITKIFFITYIKTKIKLNERNFKGKYERIYSYNQQEQPDERNYFNQISFGGKIFMLS